MIKGILNYAHHLLEESVSKGETVIDATCGNGNDTVFLSKTVGDEGRVLAFDIQRQAIQNTRQLVDENNAQNVSLINDSHAHTAKYLRSEEHTSELQSRGHLVCRLLLEKKKK